MNRYALRNSSNKLVARGFSNKKEAKDAREKNQFVTKDVDHPDYGVKRTSSIHPPKGGVFKKNKKRK